jgi:hypothetical protein
MPCPRALIDSRKRSKSEQQARAASKPSGVTSLLLIGYHLIGVVIALARAGRHLRPHHELSN